MSNQNWKTPNFLLRAIIHNVAPINFDAACTTEDKVTEDGFFFDKGMDALKSEWTAKYIFCNPPWKQAKYFVKQAFEQFKKHNTSIVMTIPASTNTDYFHKYIFHKAGVYFPNQRIAYIDSNNPEKKSPMHETMVILYSQFQDPTVFHALDVKKYKIKGENENV